MYRALYRKWRPQCFTDVYGQRHITDTLMHEVEANRFSHAYLFTGSRGTGKTTCAKILAKAVNCLHPVNGNPCNECEMCRGIDDGSVLDVIEIDAASNNGVDNIRDLREEANFTPAAAKYRVYIIDEVHMLSQGAFNALLKTLEEPPEHVLFILATTEVQKLPATILSRCQRFDFRRIPPEDISARLLEVANNEGISLTNEAALLIARIADGALRDALSILDQCAGSGEAVTVETVSSCAGLLGRGYLFELSDAVYSGNAAAALEVIDRLHSSSCDMERLLSELVNHFRNVLLVKTLKKPEELVVCTPEELQKYKALSEKMTNGSLLYIMETLCREASALKYSSYQRAQTETVLIRLCNPQLSTDVSALASEIENLKAEIGRLKANGIKAAPASSKIGEELKEKPADKPAKAENPPQTAVEEEQIAPKHMESETPLQIKSDVPEHIEPTHEKPHNEAVSDAIGDFKEAEENFGVVTESDKALPFTAWDSVLKQISATNKPLYPFLLGSSAFRAGNTVFIKAKNTAFASMFKQPFTVQSIADALSGATGEKLRPALYSDGASPHAEEAAEPVDSLINKLSKLKIDFIIEE